MGRLNTGLNIAGIYRIVNTVNNHIYIGSTRNIRKRESGHFCKLIRGVHHSTYLQNSFNVHGLESFKFEIVEIVDNENDLLKREQYYLDTLNPEYNMCKIAKSTVGFSHTEATKRKMSKARTGYKLPKEVIEKVVKTRMDKITEEERRQRNEARIKKKRTNYNLYRRLKRQQARLEKSNTIIL